MIAVISDLHLQHTGMDAIRYRKNGEVREAGVRRNLTAAAFNRFTEMVEARVRPLDRRGEVHLVLAGDIFELHRTPLWFMGEDYDLRPFMRPDERLCKKLLEILSKIEEEDARDASRMFLPTLRQYVKSHQGAKGTYRVYLHYIPGNHDRLANAWPSVREKVRETLGMEPSEEFFPNRLDFTGDGLPNYRVRIRHGHEYDVFNTALTVQRARSLNGSLDDYLLPCVGDYMTIDVAARLATAFRIRYAEELRKTGTTADELRCLYQKLTEFDDVRPAFQLFNYLATDMKALKGKFFGYLQPIVLDMVQTASHDRFFQKEASRLKKWWGLLANLFHWALKNIPPKALAEVEPWIPAKIKGEAARGPADVARYEPGLGKMFDVVVAGHTHNPDQVSLPRKGTNEQTFFLDTGTWRSTIRYGRETFGRLRGYTMVFCYSKKEREIEGRDRRRFETWTGHLAWPAGATLGKQAVPYDEPVDADFPPANVMRLCFERLLVQKIQKEWLNGAEIEMHFGVDGHKRTLRKDRVYAGEDIDLSQIPPIDLDPSLDGEVWAYGVELDWGVWPHPHDPLPWAIDRLPREPLLKKEPITTRKQFIETDGKLILKGKADAHLILEYQVERAGQPAAPATTASPGSVPG